MLVQKTARTPTKAATARRSGPSRMPVTSAPRRGSQADSARLQPSWDFAEVPLFAPESSSAILQAKLAVGPVDDPLEREADRVAEQVMRMAEPAALSQSAPLQLSRKCTECEEEDKQKLQ